MLKYLRKQKGNLLLEVVLALAIIGILLGSATAYPYNLTRTSVEIASRRQANVLAEEAVESLRGIQYENWTLVPNSPYSNPYRVEKNVSGWFLTSGSETIGEFRREILFSDVRRDVNGNISSAGSIDPYTKKAEVTVYWNSPVGELNTRLITYLSNWQIGYGNESRAEGLMAQWHLDENSGNQAFDSIGNNDGTINGTTTWVPGVSNSALRFENAGDYVEVPDAEDLDVSNSMSLSAWFKPTDALSSGGIIKSGAYAMGANTTNVFATINSTTITAAAIPDWNNLIMTFDNTLASEQFKLYLNGILVGTAELIDPVDVTTTNLFFGQDFIGTVDEIALYDYALDITQVESEYEEESFPENLSSTWTFDETMGDTLHDASGTFDGTIYGVTWTTGVFGSALEFDGTDDYIEQDLQLTADYPFAISGWINTTANNNQDMVIFSLADKDSSNAYYGILIDKDGYVGIWARNPAVRRVFGDVDVRDGDWHFVMGVFASSTDRRIYLDGQIQATDTEEVTFTPDVDRWSIGRWGDSSSGGFFEGIIDGVGFWDSDFTDQEVLDLYNSSQP